MVILRSDCISISAVAEKMQHFWQNTIKILPNTKAMVPLFLIELSSSVLLNIIDMSDAIFNAAGKFLNQFR